MSMKQGVIGLVVVFVLGCAIGRFSLPAKVVTKTVTVEAKTKDTDTTNHDKITVTETTRTDGSVTKVTQIQKNTTQDTKLTDNKSSDTTKTVEYNTARWSVMAVATSHPLKGMFTPTYGGEIEYRLIGPIKIGALGLSDGTMGLSLGLQF